MRNAARGLAKGAGIMELILSSDEVKPEVPVLVQDEVCISGRTNKPIQWDYACSFYKIQKDDQTHLQQ